MHPGAEVLRTRSASQPLGDGGEPGGEPLDGVPAGVRSLAEHLYAAAAKYQLPQLASLCSLELVESLAVQSVCDRFALAQMYDDGRLRTACVKLVDEHMEDATQSEGFLRLEKEQLRELMQNMAELRARPESVPSWVVHKADEGPAGAGRRQWRSHAVAGISQRDVDGGSSGQHRISAGLDFSHRIYGVFV